MPANDRRLHFVGTMPQFADAQAAFQFQLDNLDGRLRRLSSGETGPRLLWFVSLVKELKLLRQIRTVHSGDWTGYDDTDLLKVRRGSRLTAADIPLRIAQYAHAELALLENMGAPASPQRPLQVGVPGYLDMALFTFGPLGVFRLGRTFLKAVAAQLADIHRTAGDNVVFQLEVPAALIAVASTPPPLRTPMAALMARLVTRQVARAPQGSRFGVHLCLGDLGHRALRQLRTADPLVRLANAIIRQWPSGRRLEYLHLPMSGGDQPPVTDPGFYEPLRRLPDGVPLIAGIAHESQDYADQLTVRTAVEAAAGRPVDIATSCGLGRRTPEEARQAVDSMRALLKES